MKFCRLVLLIGVFVAAACHPGPVVGPGGNPDVGGTIAGIVSTEGKAPLATRKVTATNTATGEKFEATTGTNGGYTIKVPQGTYRLDVELHEGEKITKHPGDTKIQKSDLDPQRDFVISSGRAGGL
jgi:hypothetical protein